MKIEYTVTIEPLSDTESLASVTITPAERFNGFSGGTIKFPVSKKNQKAAISERVKVKIAQEVGQSNVEIIERVSP